jgi:UDP-glucose 4-epimerase
MTVAACPGASFSTREFPQDRAAIDIGSYHADDSAFRAATGWAAATSLPDGIARTLEWYRPRLAAYL